MKYFLYRNLEQEKQWFWEKLYQSKNFYFVAGFHGSRFCQAKINLRATGFMYLALRGKNLKLVKNTKK